MKILLLPNALKGSLSAKQFIRIAIRTLTNHTVRAFPISDGGDGFADFFRTCYPKAKPVFLQAKNAFLQNKKTSFLYLPATKTAVIETARICGLGNTPKNKLDPLGASSYGVGQAIKKAIQLGAKQIYVGLGGVACSDGGAGMAVACNAVLTDREGRPVPPGAAPLLEAFRLDLIPVKKLLKGVKIYAVSDVDNPVLGRKSSAKVFGAQKGASPAQIKQLDRALSIWVHLLEKETGLLIAREPGTAAAGAIAAGLYGAFGAEIHLGAEVLFQKARLEKQIKWADLIITSEGKLDRQTFYGKAPLAVLKKAREQRKKVLFICGQLETSALKKQPLPRLQLAVLTDFALSADDAQKHAATYVARLLKMLNNCQ
jgi:glycerate kinase